MRRGDVPQRVAVTRDDAEEFTLPARVRDAALLISVSPMAKGLGFGDDDRETFARAEGLRGGSRRPGAWIRAAREVARDRGVAHGDGLAHEVRDAPEREDGELVVAFAGGVVQHGLAVDEVQLESRRGGALGEGEFGFLGDERLGVLGGGAEALLERLAELLLVRPAELVRARQGQGLRNMARRGRRAARSAARDVRSSPA